MKLRKYTEIEITDEEFAELFAQWVYNQTGFEIGEMSLILDNMSMDYNTRGVEDVFSSAPSPLKVIESVEYNFQLKGFKA